MINKHTWLIFIFYFISGFSLVNAEIYHIIYVRGEILLKKNKIILKTGMKISSDDQLIFKQKDAKAVVMSNLRGRFTLMLHKPEQSSELVAFAKDVILPIKTNAAASTRGNIGSVRDFKDYFGDSTFFVIGNKLEFETDRNQYKINENQYFQIRYQSADSLMIKKVSATNNLISLDFVDLLKDKKGKSISPEKVEFYWFVNRPRTQKRLASFQPILIQKEELKIQYTELFKLIENQKLNDEEYKDYVYGYFKEVYGKTDENALESWLEENFKK